jgi:hypothetical protein
MEILTFQRYLGHLSKDDDPLPYHTLFTNGNLLERDVNLLGAVSDIGRLP